MDVMRVTRLTGVRDCCAFRLPQRLFLKALDKRKEKKLTRRTFDAYRAFHVL